MVDEVVFIINGIRVKVTLEPLPQEVTLPIHDTGEVSNLHDMASPSMKEPDPGPSSGKTWFDKKPFKVKSPKKHKDD